MRLFTVVVVLLFLGCRSDTAWRALTVTTEAEIKLPLEAIYGNISSFSGLNAAAPDVFIQEKIDPKNEFLTRYIQLADGAIIIDELVHSDLQNKSIQYRCRETNLPVKKWQNILTVSPSRAADHCMLSWSATLDVQNLNRDKIKTKIEGIQESYILSLQLLGEEMEAMLNDPDF